MNSLIFYLVALPFFYIYAQRYIKTSYPIDAVIFYLFIRLAIEDLEAIDVGDTEWLNISTGKDLWLSSPGGQLIIKIFQQNGIIDMYTKLQHLLVALSFAFIFQQTKKMNLNVNVQYSMYLINMVILYPIILKTNYIETTNYAYIINYILFLILIFIKKPNIPILVTMMGTTFLIHPISILTLPVFLSILNDKLPHLKYNASKVMKLIGGLASPSLISYLLVSILGYTFSKGDLSGAVDGLFQINKFDQKHLKVIIFGLVVSGAASSIIILFITKTNSFKNLIVILPSIITFLVFGYDLSYYGAIIRDLDLIKSTLVSVNILVLYLIKQKNNELACDRVNKINSILVISTITTSMLLFV
jgi:hypothetical protein